MPLKVYLSDTSSELQDLRRVLRQEIIRWEITPLELSDQDKQSPDVVDIARRKIQEADYFIAVVTYKRAWEPDNLGGKRSMAEVEYDLAREYGKPTTVLLPEDRSEIAMYLRLRTVGDSPADRIEQREFWKRLEDSGQVVYFEDEADLSRKVMDTLKAVQRSGKVATQVSSTISPERAQQFFAADEIEVIADRVAEKTAVRLQEIQQTEQDNLAEQAVKYNEALRLLPGELVFGRPSMNSQFHSDIFMIMPFAAAYDGVYREIIRPLAAELNLTVRRGDEFLSSRGSIMEEVWAALNACRFVIAEITGGNDNVFYELGIAHTLNKPAILMTQASSPEMVPFDVRHLRYIQYENTSEGAARLRESLKTAIERLVADLEEGWGPQG